MKPTKEGVALLRRVIKRIQEEPKRLDMELWGLKASALGYSEEESPACGTVACIAGWAILDRMTSRELKNMRESTLTRKMEKAAAKAHRLILGTRKGATTGMFGGYSGPLAPLFYPEEWPAPFDHQYQKARSPQAIATIAIARIRHFIKTGE